MLINSKYGFGWITILLHWTTAIAILFLFALGIWMVTLDYYDPWYNKSQVLHESIGVITLLLIMVRVVAAIVQPKVQPLTTEILAKMAHWFHRLLYLLVIVVGVFGFLISADGNESIVVFDIFPFPSTGTVIEQQAEIAGLYHQYIAYILMLLVLLHTLAALKHHYLHKNNVLKRMLIAKEELGYQPIKTAKEQL